LLEAQGEVVSSPLIDNLPALVGLFLFEFENCVPELLFEQRQIRILVHFLGSWVDDDSVDLLTLAVEQGQDMSASVTMVEQIQSLVGMTWQICDLVVLKNVQL
jgi:hypothetical protein